MTTDIETLVSEAIGLLKSLIAIPSLSREEEQAADFLQNYIEMQGMATGRKGNNIWCLSPMHDFEHEPVHDLFQQWRMVKETLRNMVGETAPSYLD